MYLEIEIIALIILFGMFTGVGIFALFDARRRRKLADLRTNPELRAYTITRNAFEEYLWSLEKALEKTKLVMGDMILPRNARPGLEKAIERYWVASVEELRKRDWDATAEALCVRGYQTEPPYGKLPPHGKGPAPVCVR